VRLPRLFAFAFFALSACEGRSETTRSASESATAQQALVEATATSRGPGDRAPAALAGDGSNHCTRVCELTRELDCPGQAGCVQACTRASTVPFCQEQLTEVFECMTAQSVDAWLCGDAGLAEIRQGYCDAEQAAFVRCAQSAAQAP
jgi:hypothetical protein